MKWKKEENCCYSLYRVDEADNFATLIINRNNGKLTEVSLDWTETYLGNYRTIDNAEDKTDADLLRAATNIIVEYLKEEVNYNLKILKEIVSS